MSLSPLTFTGISKFSSDFQVIVDRAVSIAALPVKALQNDQQNLLEKKSAFANLRNSTGSLASSIQALGALNQGQAMTASASSAAITPTLRVGATPGTYQISEITSIAAPASYTSGTGWATSTQTQISTGTDHKLELLVGGVSKEIQLTAATDNLTGLRDAINALDAGVNAGIIDTGAAGQRYFLALSAKDSGLQTLELRTESGNAASGTMAVTNPGSDLSFKINGHLVTAKENMVTDVIPGVAFDVRDTTAPGEVINLTVESNTAPVVSALNSFVEAYNQLASDIGAHIGPSAGVLSGDSVLSDLSARLRQTTGYAGSGSIQSLAEIGISLDANGVMSFDEFAVSGASEGELKDILSFFGSATTGFAALADRFSEYSSPIGGMIVNRIAGIDETDARLTEQINSMADRISLMQSSLMAQLQAADALLASLDSQQSILTASIDSLNTVTNGKREG